MTVPSALQSNPLSPVPSGVNILQNQSQLVNYTWNKWFTDLRVKINVINQTLAAWSGISPVTGLTPGTYGDTTHYPIVTINQYGMITNITTQASSGGGGNPIHVTNVTSSYTIVSGDIPLASAYRGMVVITNSSANQVNIDKFANTSIPVGADLLVLQNGIGATTINGVAGVTLVGPTIAGGGQYSLGRAIQIVQDTWIISGNLSWSSGPPTTFYAYAISLSPVAYWRMNDTSGTNLVDSIAGYTATLSGAYTLGGPGMVSGGGSVAFNGGYAATSASATWALGTGDFSLFIIGNWTTTTSPSCLLYIRDGSNLLGSFNANRLSTGDIETEGWYWASGGRISTGTSMNNGTNQGVCCVYISATSTLYLYTKSGLAGSVVVGGTRPTVSSMITYIATNTPGTQVFVGSLAELLLFNKALTATQISNLMGYIL